MQIEWALADIREAMALASHDENRARQQSCNALVNARRAVACLADWTLSAFGFTNCRDFSNQKAAVRSGLLRHLGYFDEVTELVLANGINKRNELEHRYRLSELEEASDFVELVRHLFENLKANKWPGHGPCCFGTVNGGTSWSAESGHRGSFYGWGSTPPFLVIGTYDDPAWLGLVSPVSNDGAEVRFTNIGILRTEELLNLYSAINYNVNNRKGGSWMSTEALRAKMGAVGLLRPALGK